MKNFKKYSKERIYFYDKTVPELLTGLIIKSRPNSLADFGCGDGALLFELQKKGLLETADEVVAIDLSTLRLERVKKYIPNTKTLCSDVCNVRELKDSQLDLVTCAQVIEHVEDDGKLLKEIQRVLKPKGYLYISSVVKKWYGWWLYKCNGKITCDPTHLREYVSKEEFIQLLEKHNFKVLETNLTLFKPSIINALNRVLIRQGILNEDKVRSLYTNSKLFRFISNHLRIPVPGYYIIEAVAVFNTG